MHRFSLVSLSVSTSLFLLLASSCSSSGGRATSSALPGHGAISVTILPNPIVALKATGDQYDFPFEVVVKETGGHPVKISRVTADVKALGTIPVATESYDAARIAALGFATTVPANGELRYRFNPRKSVPDDRLFGNVTADLTVDGADDTGSPATARTRVTVQR
jgi:hypothetical protein